VSNTILSIGVLVFLSHFLSILFRRTNIPDVLVLMGLGLLLGPLLGVVQPGDFGKAGSVIATIALVVILFEGGTSLRIDVMRKALGLTSKLTLVCFVLTAAIVGGLGVVLLELQPLPAALLGAILAGTSSAVVIPMVESLRMSEKPATVLVLESALTDVLCIVSVFALLQVIGVGEVEPGKMLGSVLSALVFAIVIGIAGGAGWLLILGKVRDFPNTISSTVAYAFIVYGVSEFLGFSGAIAVMALGLTLTNFEALGLTRFKPLSRKVEALTELDIAFYREAVFLLKTYFFVYLGISIQFSGPTLAVVALGMMAAVFAMRLVLTRVVYRGPEYSLRDTALTSMLAPKGLAAAVLATVPLQRGVPGGEVIRDAANMVVLVSISLCAVLIILYSTRPIRRIYGVLLGKPADVSPGPDGGAGK
jgi:NhaP-type Na+/H+ or K+/H+ antiporter